MEKMSHPKRTVKGTKKKSTSLPPLSSPSGSKTRISELDESRSILSDRFGTYFLDEGSTFSGSQQTGDPSFVCRLTGSVSSLPTFNESLISQESNPSENVSALASMTLKASTRELAALQDTITPALEGTPLIMERWSIRKTAKKQQAELNTLIANEGIHLSTLDSNAMASATRLYNSLVSFFLHQVPTPPKAYQSLVLNYAQHIVSRGTALAYPRESDYRMWQVKLDKTSHNRTVKHVTTVIGKLFRLLANHAKAVSSVQNELLFSAEKMRTSHVSQLKWQVEAIPAQRDELFSLWRFARENCVRELDVWLAGQLRKDLGNGVTTTELVSSSVENETHQSITNSDVVMTESISSTTLNRSTELLDAVDPEYGLTALHYAAKHGCIDIIRYLVKHHVRVNIRAPDLRTPLHFAAAYCSDRRVCLELLASGADPGLRDAFTCLAIDLARQNGNVAIVSVLENWKGLSIAEVMATSTQEALQHDVIDTTVVPGHTSSLMQDEDKLGSIPMEYRPSPPHVFQSMSPSLRLLSKRLHTHNPFLSILDTTDTVDTQWMSTGHTPLLPRDISQKKMVEENKIIPLPIQRLHLRLFTPSTPQIPFDQHFYDHSPILVEENTQDLSLKTADPSLYWSLNMSASEICADIRLCNRHFTQAVREEFWDDAVRSLRRRWVLARILYRELRTEELRRHEAAIVEARIAREKAEEEAQKLNISSFSDSHHASILEEQLITKISGIVAESSEPVDIGKLAVVYDALTRDEQLEELVDPLLSISSLHEGSTSTYNPEEYAQSMELATQSIASMRESVERSVPTIRVVQLSSKLFMETTDPVPQEHEDTLRAGIPLPESHSFTSSLEIEENNTIGDLKTNNSLILPEPVPVNSSYICELLEAFSARHSRDLRRRYLQSMRFPIENEKVMVPQTNILSIASLISTSSVIEPKLSINQTPTPVHRKLQSRHFRAIQSSATQIEFGNSQLTIDDNGSDSDDSVEVAASSIGISNVHEADTNYLVRLGAELAEVLVVRGALVTALQVLDEATIMERRLLPSLRMALITQRCDLLLHLSLHWETYRRAVAEYLARRSDLYPPPSDQPIPVPMADSILDVTKSSNERLLLGSTEEAFDDVVTVNHDTNIASIFEADALTIECTDQLRARFNFSYTRLEQARNTVRPADIFHRRVLLAVIWAAQDLIETSYALMDISFIEPLGIAQALSFLAQAHERLGFSGDACDFSDRASATVLRIVDANDNAIEILLQTIRIHIRYRCRDEVELRDVSLRIAEANQTISRLPANNKNTQSYWKQTAELLALATLAVRGGHQVLETLANSETLRK